MSAVASAIATTSPAHWTASRWIAGPAVAAAAPEAESPFVDELDWREAPAADPESLLLACCAAQIAGEAGPHAVVHAIGAGRQAALLSAALAALPRAHPERNNAGPALVYVPRLVTAALDADAMLALLRRFAELHGDDALVVVALESRGSADERTSERACDRNGCSTPWLDRLARIAGWQLCQLWTDGTARHALHVLERSARTDLLRAS